MVPAFQVDVAHEYHVYVGKSCTQADVDRWMQIIFFWEHIYSLCGGKISVCIVDPWRKLYRHHNCRSSNE